MLKSARTFNRVQCVEKSFMSFTDYWTPTGRSHSEWTNRQWFYGRLHFEYVIKHACEAYGEKYAPLGQTTANTKKTTMHTLLFEAERIPNYPLEPL